jgi:hypothetical protein
MKARFFSGVLPAALGAVFLACGPAWSDVIVLLNGRTLQGTLADRDEFASNVRAHDDVVILLDTGPRAQPQLRRLAVDEIDFVVLEANGERRVVDVHRGGDIDSELDPGISRPATPRFPYTEGPSRANSEARDSGRLGTGAALLLVGAAGVISGAVIEFDSWEPITWTVGYSVAQEVDYDTRNYIVMGIGGIVMLTGLALIASSGRPPRHAVALELEGEQPVLAYRTNF